MKIGILTFHCAHNYGAILQAYASKIFLEQNGHEGYFIDYRPKAIVSKYKVFTRSRFLSRSFFTFIRKLKDEIPFIYKRIKKFNAFESFINKRLLENGKKKINLSNELRNLDCYLLGSDQIWNISLLGYFDNIYWGNLPIVKPMFSYAVSMENEIPPFYHSQISKSLCRFDAISVREEIIKDMLQKEFKIDAKTVLDPTFLISKNDWLKIEETLKVPQRYVLLYYFGVSNNIVEEAELFARKNNCKLIVISIGVLKDKRFINNVNPGNFVYLFHHALYVITNSFHGTAFSIIFEKPFYVITKKGTTNYRINQLCKLCGLTERIIDTFDRNSSWNENIKISENLKKLKLESQDYIINTIKLITH